MDEEEKILRWIDAEKLRDSKDRLVTRITDLEHDSDGLKILHGTQQAKIKDLEDEVALLRDQVTNLQARLAAVEARPFPVQPYQPQIPYQPCQPYPGPWWGITNPLTVTTHTETGTSNVPQIQCGLVKNTEITWDPAAHGTFSDFKYTFVDKDGNQW